MSEREERKGRPIYVLMPFFPIINMDEILRKIWPKGYEESLEHLINARIEILKAINSALEKRIKELESAKAELKEVKREKVKVE